MRTLIAAAIVIAAATPADAQSTEKRLIGQWELHTEESKLDGQRSVLIGLDSTTLDDGKPAQLWLGCRNRREFGVIITMPQHVTFNDSTSLKWRSGDSPLRTASWAVPRRGDGVIQINSPRAKEFIDSLTPDSELILRVGPSQEATFDLRKLEEVRTELAIECRNSR